MYVKRKDNGFTIVELLIVIVVIAVLAAIVIVAYNGMQARAKASQIESMYNAANKAFRLVAVDKNWTTWPLDNTVTGTPNPTLQSITTTSDFKNYMQSVSVPSGVTVQYDNDNDTYNGCSVGGTGPSFFMQGVSVEIAQQIDSSIDDGDLSCGKVTRNSSTSEFKIYLTYGQNIE